MNTDTGTVPLLHAAATSEQRVAPGGGVPTRERKPRGLGIVQAVVPRKCGLHEDPAGFARRITAECVRTIPLQRRAAE
jgi:hypothetical protein